MMATNSRDILDQIAEEYFGTGMMDCTSNQQGALQTAFQAGWALGHLECTEEHDHDRCE